MTAADLTPAQRAMLAFCGALHPPHGHEWLDDAGRVRSPTKAEQRVWRLRLHRRGDDRGLCCHVGEGADALALQAAGLIDRRFRATPAGKALVLPERPARQRRAAA